MKKRTFISILLVICMSFSISAYAADVALYALDGRVISVAVDEVEAYTAPGMGWFLNKPVEMYSADGRTITVPYESVEAYKNVGWFVNENQPVFEEKKVLIRYTEGTVIEVPEAHVEMYKTLGWVLAESGEVKEPSSFMMRSPEGVVKEVKASDVYKYEQAGWVKTKDQIAEPSQPSTEPQVKYMTVYSQDGSTQEIDSKKYSEYEKQGWFHSFDAAVYSYAIFGLGDVQGAQALKDAKKYEQAFNMVQSGIEKIESTNSDYVPMLHYMRSLIMNEWQVVENAPIAMVGYEFTTKSGSEVIILDYRNISSNRIQSFKVNFDICDKDGNIVETNSAFYSASKLEMKPYDKKRCAWKVENGDATITIKNLRVLEVVFSDNTKWTK